MSRLEIKTPSQAQAVVDQLYRNVERRIAASPPGLCPIDMALNFLNLCHAQTCGKCVPCRIGLGQLSQMLQEVLDGEADHARSSTALRDRPDHCGHRGLRHRHQRGPPGADGPAGLPGRL